MLVLLAIVVLVATFFFRHTTEDTVQITVTRAERVTQGSGKNIESFYLVWTTTPDGEEVFSVKDDFTHGTFNASDIYGRLQVGHRYVVKVSGKRIPSLSHYRNIYAVEKEISQLQSKEGLGPLSFLGIFYLSCTREHKDAWRGSTRPMECAGTALLINGYLTSAYYT